MFFITHEEIYIIFTKLDHQVDRFLLNIENKLFIQRFREHYNLVFGTVVYFQCLHIQALESHCAQQDETIQQLQKKVARLRSRQCATKRISAG